MWFYWLTGVELRSNFVLLRSFDSTPSNYLCSFIWFLMWLKSWRDEDHEKWGFEHVILVNFQSFWLCIIKTWKEREKDHLFEIESIFVVFPVFGLYLNTQNLEKLLYNLQSFWLRIIKTWKEREKDHLYEIGNIFGVSPAIQTVRITQILEYLLPEKSGKSPFVWDWGILVVFPVFRLYINTQILEKLLFKCDLSSFIRPLITEDEL